MTTIDQPPCWEGETRAQHFHGEPHVGRCVHDMLRGQCSWCRGLPERDVPIDFGLSLAEVPDLTAWLMPNPTVVSSALRFITVDRPEECVRCAERTTVLAYSVEYAGSICRTCAA